MKHFQFIGRIPGSKSMLIRAEFLRSFIPNLRVEGTSKAEDVQLAHAISQKFLDHDNLEPLNCGASAAVLRFACLRALRHGGQWWLKGSDRLTQRLPAELTKLIHQLGGTITQSHGLIEINSSGWCPYGDMIEVPVENTSQLLSAALLNSWQFEKDLFFRYSGKPASGGYFRMTEQMVRSLGMDLRLSPDGIHIPRHNPSKSILLSEHPSLVAEPDMSSAFAVAALGAVAGTCDLLDMPARSLQPDGIFEEILRAMGAGVERSGQALRVEQKALRCLDWDLNATPDLFPVLAVLCAFAKGKSRLTGAPHLKHKESDRIQTTVDFLLRIGISATALDDGAIIEGNPDLTLSEPLVFDPSDDHRLVMAATIAQWKGLPIHIRNPDCVRKSFPEFLSFVRPTA